MAEENTGTQQQGANNTQSGGGQQSAAPQAQAATFTQADLDRIINERLARERSKFADYDELKKYREEQDAKSKTETEKLAERAAKAEQKVKEVAEQTTARLLNAEARAQAAELGFLKPDKAIKLLELNDAVTNGEVDAAKVKAALETLAKEMPELLKPTKPTVPQAGATNPPKGSNTGESDKEKWTRLYGGTGLSDWLGAGKVQYYPKPGDEK